MTDATSTAFESENLQAETLISENNLPAAARILVDIVQQDPKNARAYNNMGIVSWVQHEWTDAFAMFKRACALAPDFEDALINLFDASLKLKCIKEVTPLFAMAASILPASSEIAAISEAIADPDNDVYASERALRLGFYLPLVDEGNALLQSGSYLPAAEKFLASIDKNGPDADAYCGLGLVSFYRTEYKEAFALFLEAVKQNPFKTDAFLNLAEAAAQCGLEEDALKVYDIFRAEFPGIAAIETEFRDLLAPKAS